MFFVAHLHVNSLNEKVKKYDKQLRALNKPIIGIITILNAVDILEDNNNIWRKKFITYM